MSINKNPDVQPIYVTSIDKLYADGHPVIPYDADVTLKVYFLKPSDLANPNSQVLPKYEAYLAKDGGGYAADDIQRITRVQASYALASTYNFININLETTEDPDAQAEGSGLTFFSQAVETPFHQTELSV